MEIWSPRTSSSARPVQLSRTEPPEMLSVVYLGFSPTHTFTYQTPIAFKLQKKSLKVFLVVL